VPEYFEFEYWVESNVPVRTSAIDPDLEFEWLLGFEGGKKVVAL
jgi:hypothetical protein